MSVTFFIMRHSWYDANGLTPEGHDRARDLGDLLEQNGVHFDAVVSSDQLRANLTAQLAGKTSKPTIIPDLYRGEFSEEGHEEKQAELLRQFPSEGNILVVAHEDTVGALMALLSKDKAFSGEHVRYTNCGGLIFKGVIQDGQVQGEFERVGFFGFVDQHGEISGPIFRRFDAEEPSQENILTREDVLKARQERKAARKTASTGLNA